METQAHTPLTKAAGLVAMFVLSTPAGGMVSATQVVAESLRANETASCSRWTAPTWLRAENPSSRLERVRSVRGKYASLCTSSETFAHRKQQELDSES